MRALQLIADSYLQPDAHQLALEPSMMWELAGGDEGLKRMSVNAGLMLELAAVAEQWNMVEGVIVAEMLRRDALRLRKALRHIRWSMLWNSASVSAAFHLREAVSSYCLLPDARAAARALPERPRRARAAARSSDVGLRYWQAILNASQRQNLQREVSN